MPRATEPVKRICYEDDITVWASGVKLPELEHKINDYQTEMSCFLRDNSLLISAPKSTVTMFTPYPKQANTHPKIKISDSELPFVRNPKLTTESAKEIMSWKQWQAQTGDNKKKRYCLTYKALGKSIANYAAPIWSINASDSLGTIQRTQNEALRIITGSHKMPSIDHLHSETKILLVEDHLIILSAQYLVHCLDTENACHHITTMDHPPREMKETLFTRHNQTVVPLLANTMKASLQAVHTSFVNTAIDNMTDNRALNYQPPPISDAPHTPPLWPLKTYGTDLSRRYENWAF